MSNGTLSGIELMKLSQLYICFLSYSEIYNETRLKRKIHLSIMIAFSSDNNKIDYKEKIEYPCISMHIHVYPIVINDLFRLKY
jgi:hypothetical protein